MQKLLFSLLFIFCVGLAVPADAQNRPRVKAKRTFAHSSESSKRKNNKARFRPVNNIRPVIDLNPHSQEKFKTAKAGRNFKFSKGNGFK